MAADGPADVEELARGQRSGLRPGEAGLRVADGPGEWADLWAGHGAGEVPEVDHDEAWVALVLLGERPTGGYAVVVEEVRAGDDAYVVHAREREPEAGAVVTQSLTYPWVAVAVERSAGPPGDPELVLESG